MNWLTSYLTAARDANSGNALSVPVPGLRNLTGIGDVVSSVTSAFGAESASCSPCDERRRWLNEHFRLVPYGTGPGVDVGGVDTDGGLG